MPTLHLRQRLRGLAPRSAANPGPGFVPSDPATLGVALDPALAELRSTVVCHRRRLWLRRSVRRAWFVLAAVAVAGLVLAVAQRLLPLEHAPIVALALPFVGAIVLLLLVVRARPTLGETAIAVDAEGGAGDRVASALAFAGALPGIAGPGPAADAVGDAIRVGVGLDLCIIHI